MAKCKRAAFIAVVGMVLPQSLFARGVADDIGGLQTVLDQLYTEMMPLCKDLITVGRSIAGFAALWYIASRVWKHIASSEPIDFYPLFRPFALGFCIIMFPAVISLINGVMMPTVTGTAKMVEGSDKAITALLKEKEEALKKTPLWEMYVGDNDEGNRDQWYRYTHDNKDPSNEGMLESIGNDIRFSMSKWKYNTQNAVKEVLSQILKIVFQAAALCINTLRTFQLIVLAILGPLAFGIAVFDGFQHTLTAWIAKYINIFLWLPVANIFGAIIGKIQEQMLKLDLSQINTAGDTFFSSNDIAYMVFMLIAIVGYTTVPSVANSIVNAGGGGGLQQKITSMTSGAGGIATGGAGAFGSRSMDAIGNISHIPGQVSEGYYGKDKQSGSGYMGDKLSGNV
ncbi:conjugative transposon protein TraJ [Pedobacter frigoris]|uniref:conjugative transposon protein TraJ n=1 Tax=Pedobacter frigoris TaxID=2571272 RepID=UPI00292DFB11|nr:conjugative transposon protein TraJ [Pedobacter frigoris]